MLTDYVPTVSYIMNMIAFLDIVSHPIHGLPKIQPCGILMCHLLKVLIN